MRYVHDKKHRSIVKRAKKLMDNDISGNGEKYCSAVIIKIMFLCFKSKCNFD